MRFARPAAKSGNKIERTATQIREQLGILEHDLRGYSRSFFIEHSLNLLAKYGTALNRAVRRQPEYEADVQVLNKQLVALIRSLTGEKNKIMGGLDLQHLPVDTIIALMGAYEGVGRLQGTATLVPNPTR